MILRLVPIIFVLISSCGGSGGAVSGDVVTDSPPVISRIDPSAGAAGSQFSVFGLGFSNEASNNIVMVGTSAVAAFDYALVDNPSGSELEFISFVLPQGISAGVYNVNVIVNDETSNTASLIVTQ